VEQHLTSEQWKELDPQMYEKMVLEIESGWALMFPDKDYNKCKIWDVVVFPVTVEQDGFAVAIATGIHVWFEDEHMQPFFVPLVPPVYDMI